MAEEKKITSDKDAGREDVTVLHSDEIVRILSSGGGSTDRDTFTK